jgi:hypothetical protein
MCIILPISKYDMSPESRIRVPQEVPIQTTLVVSNLKERSLSPSALEYCKIRDVWWGHIHKVSPGVNDKINCIWDSGERTRQS